MRHISEILKELLAEIKQKKERKNDARNPIS